MLTALCFIAGLVVLARMSLPKRAYVPPRATVMSIIGGAIVRIVLAGVVAGVVLVLLAAMT